MQVHLLTQRPAALAGVDEFPRELEPEPDVVTAAAPLPVPDSGDRAHAVGLRCPALVRVVTRARLDRSFAAGPRDAVRHGRAGDRVDEGRLSTSWNWEEWESISIIHLSELSPPKEG